MDIGIHYASFAPSGTRSDDPATLHADLAATARAADEGGARWLTVMDHWFQMENLGGPAEPMLEGYTTLGYLAALTSRVQLSLLVTGVTYRHPGLLAKTVTTLDVLSQGRAMLGIGAAWYDREHHGLGVPFPPLGERFERLEETLRICGQMWSADDGAFDGDHYQLAETVCVPAPVRGRVPVLIGGAGERKTLRLVAQYADACNIFASSPEEVAHKLQVLRRHCDEVGRDYDTITRSIIGMLDPFEAGFVDAMAAYAALGVELVTLMPDPAGPAAWTDRLFAEVAPQLRELSVD